MSSTARAFGTTTRTRCILVALFAILGGFIGVWMGWDPNWDLKNYHLYNPYAFLNDRLLIDIAPAQRQSYHNPLQDIPFYLLVQHLNDYPRLITFVMSVPYGLAVLLIGWLSRMILVSGAVAGSERGIWLAVAFATLIGATGAAGIRTVGSVLNETPLTALILLALALVVVRLRKAEPSSLLLFSVGLCVGVAGGLKATYAVHALAIGLALLLMVGLRRIRFPEFLTSGAGVFVGLLLSSGWWMWTLYDIFDNPLYPYFNDIFQSAAAEPVSFADDRFMPGSLWEGLLSPFRWALGGVAVAAESPFRDMRFAAVMLLAAIVALARLQHWDVRKVRNGSMPVLFLSAYAVVGFLLWLFGYGIYRYAMPLEMISGIFIVLLLQAVVSARHRLAASAIVCALLVVSTQPLEGGRLGYQDRLIDVALPAIPPESLVFFLSGEPMAYLVPFMPHDIRAIGLENNFLNSGQANASIERIRTLVAGHDGPIRAIMPEGGTFHSELLEQAGLTLDEAACEPVISNIDAPRRLCPLEDGER